MARKALSRELNAFEEESVSLVQSLPYQRNVGVILRKVIFLHLFQSLVFVSRDYLFRVKHHFY